MLVFLATLSASVAAALLVEAADIEGVRTARRRAARNVNAQPNSEASYPNGAVAGALR